MSRLRGHRWNNEISNIEETAKDDHIRQPRSATHMGKVYKEFLKIYLIRCEKTRELVKQENEQTRNLVKELITTVKDTSSQTTISQLETSIMIVNKLDSCQRDSMKRVKETLSQMNRSEFREDATCAKSQSRKHGLKSSKVERIFFGDIIATKDWKNFTILDF